MKAQRGDVLLRQEAAAEDMALRLSYQRRTSKLQKEAQTSSQVAQ